MLNYVRLELNLQDYGAGLSYTENTTMKKRPVNTEQEHNSSDYDRISPPPYFAPRTDVEIHNKLFFPGYLASVTEHLKGFRRDPVVRAEEPINRESRGIVDSVLPDLMVVFGVNELRIVGDRGYFIQPGDPIPEFVLEVGHWNTEWECLEEKISKYQKIGIREVWVFSDQVWDHNMPALKGLTLQAGQYVDIPLVVVPAQSLRNGRSQVLKLDVCWEGGDLRFFNPVTHAYLESHQEVIQRADRETQRADSEAQRADSEAQRATGAESEIETLKQQLEQLRQG